jgi:hypothetical protein
MIIYVQAENHVTQIVKKKSPKCIINKVIFGEFDTATFILTSSHGDTYNISKNFEKFHYKNRIVFIKDDEKKPEQWILTLVPSKCILESIGVNVEIESDSDVSSDSDSSDESIVHKKKPDKKTKQYSDSEEFEAQEPYSEEDVDY